MAHLHEHSLVPIAKVLTGPKQLARATLIATQLAGLILRFRIMTQLPLGEDDRAALRRKLEQVLQILIAE